MRARLETSTNRQMNRWGTRILLQRIVMTTSLERCLERFELAWQSGVFPSIAAHLSDWKTSSSDARKYLEELVKVDLEYRWHGARNPSQSGGSPDQLGQPDRQHTPQSTLRNHTSGPPAAAGELEAGSPATLPRRPLLEDYLRLHPELGPIGQLPVDLIAEEFSVRHSFGDRPHVDTYLKRFPGHGNALRIELEQTLEEILREQDVLTVRVYRDGNPVFETTFARGVELGRQRVGEQEPFARYTGPELDRLVIARLEQSTVSRRHARIELLADDKILVVNLSDARSINLRDGARIRPESSLRADVPVLLELGGIPVRIDRA